ncbi:putative hydrogenase nickel incorporation protein HypA [Sulfuriferula plumbiphila]|uniref:Hydrogenase maturation factor HypA n=1 Tax=Sulfuriferula plumbiphila TaxID=171865 RepID=A0A512LCA8_9PROT|nr:hydrogenase maturation nickel metallochaperone HypA [Sulfuriferula plumbiphila]BBP04469.1 putative hydrogenase nickel incorporation protein HypA [Sulfuriferula plumbiphila]GEP31771.1 putative hydrogenase nickel incorporation protein HypA [Sulfuriferula plumbiphila]
MHEMSLAEGVLQILEDTATHHGFQQIKRVRLEIGELACVEVESLRFCLDVVVRGSVAENTMLDIVQTPGGGWCMNCSDTVPISALFSACPRCGSYQVQPTHGTEMRVLELEGV